ncbi:replication protein RepA [Komagataeibacter saccharivorans]|uniref:replication protein RepA n=1 Tax=Komagataeibacter saccharivorans TaxID=265959 RepID=UPI0039E83557
MTEPHYDHEFPRLLLDYGYEQAAEHLRSSGRAQDIAFLDISRALLSDDKSELGVSYSGLCLTSLPHKRLPDDQVWRRTGHDVTLLIEPGTLLVNGKEQKFGVPYGARARMILIFLMSEAYRTGSREVRLGGSQRRWFERMGISFGGETAKAIRDQSKRINACSLKFFWESDSGADGFAKGGIVSSGLMFRDGLPKGDVKQGKLFDDVVVLDPVFFEALQKHHVKLREEAIRQLKDRSLALDIYVWLAYRMRKLSKPVKISWAALYDQFGGGVKLRKHFPTPFKNALKAAVAAYPEVKVELSDKEGIVLFPSPLPFHRDFVMGTNFTKVA